MIQLTEHAKSILRAIADGKEVERIATDDRGYVSISHHYALSHIGQGYGDELRIAPETRSINGVVFAAPKPECTFDIRICTGAQYLDNVTFTWSDQVERDKAMQAILDALNGVTG